jgi:hypothetical protein
VSSGGNGGIGLDGGRRRVRLDLHAAREQVVQVACHPRALGQRRGAGSLLVFELGLAQRGERGTVVVAQSPHNA